ncbi:hypothetical protein AAMO2058_000611800 [Amorphochlora amoebiformis]
MAEDVLRKRGESGTRDKAEEMTQPPSLDLAFDYCGNRSTAGIEAYLTRQEVRLPPCHYIPDTEPLFVKRLISLMDCQPEAKSILTDLIKRLNLILVLRQEEKLKSLCSIYATHFQRKEKKIHNLSASRKWGYSLGLGQKRLSESDEAKVRKETEEIEQGFLHSFVELLHDAGFVPLSDVMMRFAEENSFKLTLNSDVDYDRLDGSCIQKFLCAQKKDPGWGVRQQKTPDFAKHCLIFWRGASSREENAVFLSEKFDILFQKFLGRFLGAPASPIISNPNRASSEKAGYFLGKMKSGVYTRLSLEDTIESEGLFSLLKTSHLREVCLEEVVVLSRPKKTNDLQVVRHHGIPLADLEALLPLKLYNTWADYLLLLITLLLISSWVIGVMGNLLVIVPISLHILRRAAIYALRRNAATHRARVFLEGHLDQSAASQIAEVSHIARSAKEQQVMSLALAYALLWKHGGCPVDGEGSDFMTCDQLSKACEEFLWDSKITRTRVHLDVQKLVRRLIDLKLAKIEEEEVKDQKLVQEVNKAQVSSPREKVRSGKIRAVGLVDATAGVYGTLKSLI